MVLIKDEGLAARLRRLREHGMDVSASARHAISQPVIEHYLETGFNYRMTDIQAAIGLVQLARLPRLIARRRALAERYRELLAQIPGLALISDPPYGTTNYQSFWVLLPVDFPVSRNELMRLLADSGVSARRGVMAAHTEPAYADLAHGELPVTDRLSSSSIILPLFHEMTESDQDRVVSVIRQAAGLDVAAAMPSAGSVNAQFL
jgi:perosamine synthetase